MNVPTPSLAGVTDPAVFARQRRARDELIERGDVHSQGVDPAVIRGWQRCQAIGLDARRPVVFRAVQSSRLSAAREASEPLLEAASEEIGHLARALSPSGATVILTDSHLTTLAVRGHTDQMGRAMRSLAREGVELAERSIGSNALSICAVENDVAVVLNNGHFCEANAVFACAAAPVRSPTGALLGVLDVTTCERPLPSEAPFLVSAAAKSIENTLLLSDSRAVLIRFHPRLDFVGTALEAIVACTVDGAVVGVNAAAAAMLRIDWPLSNARFERCFRQSFGELLAQAGRLDHFSIGLVTASGTPVVARVRMPQVVCVAAPRVGTQLGRDGPVAGGDAWGWSVPPLPLSAPLPSPTSASSSSSAGTSRAPDDAGRLVDVERRTIERVVERHRGNLSSAARELGVSRGTLYRRLRPAASGRP